VTDLKTTREMLVDAITGQVGKDDPRVKGYPDYPQQWLNVDKLAASLDAF
jgi:hypothetical protein